MRSLYYYITAFFITLSVCQEGLAQERTRTRGGNTGNEGSMPELTVRAQSQNANQFRDISHVVWLREMYREIDLSEEENAPLYYPTEPIGDRMNLFTLLFKLLSEDKINAYQYIDGREIFTEPYKINFEPDVLNRFTILYDKNQVGNRTSFTINESDIPSNEVLKYMIKEVYYFDQANGTFGSKVVALCPMLLRDGDFGGVAQYPMFWIRYDDLRPYISRNYIMTSNLNNALTYTTDDFFQMNMYKGDIIKATNLMNLTLAEQFPDSTGLKRAQDSIQSQLKTFEQNLWMPVDTTTVASNQKNTKAKKEKSADSSGSEKAAKPAKTKTEKSSSTPSRSVRRR